MIDGGGCRIGPVVVDPALGIYMVVVVVAVVAVLAETVVAAERRSFVAVVEKRSDVVPVVAKLRLVVVVGMGSASVILRMALVSRHSAQVGLLHPSR